MRGLMKSVGLNRYGQPVPGVGLAVDGPTLEVLADRNSELGRHGAILRPGTLD